MHWYKWAWPERDNFDKLLLQLLLDKHVFPQERRHHEDSQNIWFSIGNTEIRSHMESQIVLFQMSSTTAVQTNTYHGTKLPSV